MYVGETSGFDFSLGASDIETTLLEQERDEGKDCGLMAVMFLAN